MAQRKAKAATTRRAPARRKATPDAIGRRGRVEAVARMLASIQARQLALDMQQTALGLKNTDIAPGYSPDSKHTVKNERDSLKEQEDRLAEAYAELLPDVEKYLDELREAQA